MATTTVLSTTVRTEPHGLLEPRTSATFAVADGVLYLLTRCCKASVTGTASGVACRACYASQPDAMGMAWIADHPDLEADLFGYWTACGIVDLPTVVGGSYMRQLAAAIAKFAREVAA